MFTFVEKWCDSGPEFWNLLIWPPLEIIERCIVIIIIIILIIIIIIMIMMMIIIIIKFSLQMPYTPPGVMS